MAARAAPPVWWWQRWPVVRGLYLHGPVGRGKTWLVDELLTQLGDVVIVRVHLVEAFTAANKALT